VFKNRVLREIVETKRDEVTGDWIKIFFEWLHDLWSSPKMENQIKKIEMDVGYSACGRAAHRL